MVISSFDPVRREVARVSMGRLVQDGRIHPGRIEQIVAKARKDVEKEMKAAGRQALYDAKISGGMHNDLLRLLGALKYRTSYGQNVLAHSVEVANLCGMMAQELGANVKIARRAALLHDVGKAIDHEVEGTHALIGGRFAKKSGESDDVVRAISAHHHEIEMETVEDVLVATADAVSAARPGARRETTETYIERLRSLEDIALGHRGVDKAYAIQAGREIRVMVQPSEVDDRIAAKLEAKSIVPGPAADKVTLLRRATFDLIGLPPTPAEVEAFLADKTPAAFERVVDRLLGEDPDGARSILFINGWRMDLSTVTALVFERGAPRPALVAAVRPR